MGIKKTIFILGLIGAGIYALQRCESTKSEEDFYPPRKGIKIEKIVDENNFGIFKGENLDELMKDIEENPEEFKDYAINISEIGLKSNYRREIWDRLNKEEKWLLIKEVSEYKANEFLHEMKRLSKDAYEKFKETEIYDNLTNERRQK